MCSMQANFWRKLWGNSTEKARSLPLTLDGLFFSSLPLCFEVIGGGNREATKLFLKLVKEHKERKMWEVVWCFLNR